jgi:hypothetical protein
MSTILGAFQLFRSRNNYKVWISKQNVGFFILRREKMGPLLVTDSCYYFLFSRFAVNYRWMEEYEKDMGPALEISEFIGKQILSYGKPMISALVVCIYDKTAEQYKFLYKRTQDAFDYLDKHKLCFGPKAFLPLSELTSKDPLG